MRSLLTGLVAPVALVVLAGCAEEPTAAPAEPAPRSSPATSAPVGTEPVGTEPAGLDLPPATADLQRVARAFLRFVRGEGPPPVDTPVGLYLGGRFVRTLPSAEAGARSAWAVCPDGGSYAGRTCPFSAVDRLAGTPRVAITSQDPRHPCAHPAPLPGAGRSVTLQPDEALACPGWFAVQLLVNDVGQVWRVNLVHAEP